MQQRMPTTLPRLPSTNSVSAKKLQKPPCRRSRQLAHPLGANMLLPPRRRGWGVPPCAPVGISHPADTQRPPTQVRRPPGTSSLAPASISLGAG